MPTEVTRPTKMRVRAVVEPLLPRADDAGLRMRKDRRAVLLAPFVEAESLLAMGLSAARHGNGHLVAVQDVDRELVCAG